MARKRTSRSLTSWRRLLLTAVPVVAVALVAVLLIARGGESTCCADDGATVQALSPAAYQSQFTSDTPHLLLDVRTPGEFADGHIEGAVNIPVESLASRIAEVPSDVPVVVYCRSGNRSATASQILNSAGYGAVYDLGGIIAWTAQGLPVVTD